MLENYFIVGIRNFARNKFFIFINILGLGIAIACCIGGYFNWKFREDWDSQHKNASTIYRVQFVQDFNGVRDKYGVSPLPLGMHVKENVVGIDGIVRYLPFNTNIRVADELFNTELVYADSGFFDLFTFTLIHGVFSDFHDKTKIFVSDQLALKYFNKTDVVGKEVTQIIGGAAYDFTIGGVFEQQPMNSSFGFDAITSYENLKAVEGYKTAETDWAGWNTLFLKINNPSQITEVEKALQQYIVLQNRARDDMKVSRFYLENFKGMANRVQENPAVRWQHLRYGIPSSAVSVPSVTAVLLLLLACFNFTNTSIATSSRRLKEIGVRKVMGASKVQLIGQFFGESLGFCALSLIVGLLLAEVIIPAYSALWPFLKLEVNYSENLGFLFFLIGLLFLTALIAGSYPALYVTSHEPVSILKDKIKLRGTNWFTRILLGLTLTISLLAVIFALAFYNNAEYQKDFNLGYTTSGIIAVDLENPRDYNVLKNALSSNPDIQIIAGTKDHIARSVYSHAVKFGTLEKEVDVLDIGDNYLEALDIKIISGRGFHQQSETDRTESVLVTEEFIDQFGLSGDPVGKRILWNDTTQLFIVGIVHDIYAHSLFEPLAPLMLRYVSPDDYRQIVIRTVPGRSGDVDREIKSAWAGLFPNTVYHSQRIESVRESFDRVNINGVKVVGCLGFIALLISVTGLYTMVSLNIIKRTKEIGIRKVLGASKLHIAKVINFEFFMLLLCSSVIGCICGYLLVDKVMAALWIYYLGLNWVTLTLCFVSMFILAAFTLGFKTFKIASLNPTKTLPAD